MERNGRAGEQRKKAWVPEQAGMNRHLIAISAASFLHNKDQIKEVNMKKVLVGLTAGVLFIAFTVHFACAQAPFGPGPGHPGAGMEMGHPLWMELPDLNIDSGRMEAIKEIRIKAVKETIRKRAELQIASIELREILGKDRADMQAVETKLKQIASFQTDIHLSHIKAIEEIKSKLTSEERKKLREFIEAAHVRPPEHLYGMKGPGPCDQPPPPERRQAGKKTPPVKEKAR